MSQDDAPASVTAERSAPVVSRPDVAADAPPRGPASGRQPRPPAGRGGAVALALLLALVATAVAGYVGWRQWQQEQSRDDATRTVSALQARLDNLAATVDGLSSDRSLLRQRLGDADQVNRSLREEVLGQSERLRDLEDAVTKLSQKTLSGHDTLLLDETEALLRMGQQRYVLFADAQGAATAYGLAEQSLAQVDDGAFSGLRQSIEAEREALAHSQPQTRGSQLATLQRLRQALPTLPLKPADRPAGKPTQGTWNRVTQALASVVRVQRESRAPLAMADARLGRDLVALDLAEAEAALLAWDHGAARAAVQRADASLASQFDTQAAPVQQARRALGTLQAALQPATPVELGAALNELRNLRAVHALQPAGAAAPPAASSRRRAPAHASSSGARP